MNEIKDQTIFISYSSPDKNQAFEICEFLEAHGIKCWIAPRNIPAGKDYPERIVDAIRKCDKFVIVFSGKTNASQHVHAELGHAFDYNKVIVPFIVEDVQLADNYIYYLRNKQWITAYWSFENALQELLDTFQSDDAVRQAHPEKPNSHIFVKPKDVCKPCVHIASYQQMVEAGVDALTIAETLVQNDLALYPGIPQENEGDAALWAQYLSSYPETFCYLVNEKKEIIGNWSFLAVSEEEHLIKLKSGELKEETFSLENTEFIFFPRDYVGYLLNMSINIGYNSAENFDMLFSAFSEQLEKFAERKIFFKSWYVNVFRQDHKAMYKAMGFKFLCHNNTYGSVYELELPALLDSFIITARGRLKKLYDEHFKK